MGASYAILAAKARSLPLSKGTLMANSNQNVALWGKSAASAGYAIHNGLPLIGISPDTGDNGFLVPVNPPAWFHLVDDEGQRDNVFRALIAHALRVGQAKVKATKEPTAAVAAEGANSVIAGSYKPGRERGNDIVEREAARAFETHIGAMVRQKNPAADQATIDATVSKYADTAYGKTTLAKFREEIIGRGTYTVSRKGAKAGDALELELPTE